MQIPDSLSLSLSENGYCFFDNVFDEMTLAYLNRYFSNNLLNLKPAHIGHKSSKMQSLDLRSDHNYWINESDPDLKNYMEMIRSVTKVLREELYLPIKSTETQIALYQPGNLYVRHQDRHKFSDHRWMTLVFYLNANWVEEHQGQLKIYLENKSEVSIDPINNRCVIFKSDLEHEVLISHHDRKSYTTWFRDDETIFKLL